MALIQLEVSKALLEAWDLRAEALRAEHGRKKPPTLYEWVTSDQQGINAVRQLRADPQLSKLPMDEGNRWLKRQHREATGYGQRTGRPKINEYRLQVLAQLLEVEAADA